MSCRVSGWPGCVGDFDALAVPAVVDVPAGCGVAPHNAQGDSFVGDQPLEDSADLASRARAQRHGDVERRDQSGLPDALATGMDVQLDLVGRLLDRDGYQRGRREDHRGGVMNVIIPVRDLAEGFRPPD